jgi:hypothetical protein
MKMYLFKFLDRNLNVIQEQKINTKFSVAYFDFDKDGTYTIKVSNISKNSVNLQIEFGDTNSQKNGSPRTYDTSRFFDNYVKFLSKNKKLQYRATR